MKSFQEWQENISFGSGQRRIRKLTTPEQSLKFRKRNLHQNISLLSDMVDSQEDIELLDELNSAIRKFIYNHIRTPRPPRRYDRIITPPGE